MSNYLQRLIARAEGVAGAPSLIPNVRREGGRQQEPDPFGATLETAESSAAEWPETTSAAPPISKLQPSNDATLTPPAPSPTGNRSRYIRRSAPEGEMPEQELDEARPIAPRDSSRRQSENVSPEDTEASTQRIVEPLRMKEESVSDAAGLKPRDSETGEREAQTLRPVDETEPLPLRKITSDAEDEIRRSNKLSQKMLERLDHLSEVVESSSQLSSEAARTETPGIAPFNLEPPRPPVEEEQRVPMPADEPRLVIGQLRVEVIPAAPSTKQEVVRVVTRDANQNRGSSVGSQTSKLRFGLGQM